MIVLEVNNINKSFGDLKAVDSVSFKVESGHIYGILGPNGAGKTTMIRMILNILVPDSGSILIFGQTMTDKLKSRIGYLPEERGLYQKMKVAELLKFLGQLHGMPISNARENARYWLEKLDFAENSDKKVEELSKGMQQKIQFISTIIHDPDLIILDEPFAGLDPVNVNMVKNIMLELKKKGKAIMFSTHIMEAAEKICDEVLMINKGKKVLDGVLLQIQSQHGKNSLQLEYEGDGAFIKPLPMIKKFNDYGNYVDVELKDGFKPNDLLKAVIDKIQIIRMEARKSSLNEIFISLAGGGQSK